jgi:hypothetical protein
MIKDNNGLEKMDIQKFPDRSFVFCGKKRFQLRAIAIIISGISKEFKAASGDSNRF